MTQAANNAVATRKDPPVLVRLPKQVLEGITERAKRNGRSRNSEIVVVLAQVLGLREQEPKSPDSVSR